MTANDIRNICLLGHGGSGKTTLAEQMLFMTKGIGSSGPYRRRQHRLRLRRRGDQAPDLYFSGLCPGQI